jgi:L-iditol 2-dehydrogenase
MKKLSEGNIHPEKLITHKLKLGELEKGLIIMRDKTEDYVKIMVKEKI